MWPVGLHIYLDQVSGGLHSACFLFTFPGRGDLFLVRLHAKARHPVANLMLKRVVLPDVTGGVTGGLPVTVAGGLRVGLMERWRGKAWVLLPVNF